MTQTIPIELQQAFEHHQAGRFAEAEALYAECAQDQPGNADLLGLLGVVRHQMGRHREALEPLERAIALSPRQANLIMAAAEAHRALGELETARRLYELATMLSPDSADAYNNLGIVLKSLGRAREAAEKLEQAVRLEPGFVEAQTNLGAVLLDLGRKEEALACLETALTLRPDDAQIHCQLGKLHMELGQLDSAERDLRQALPKLEEKAEVRCALGNLYLKQRRYREALDQYWLAQRELPNAIELQCNIGLALMGLGRRTEAHDHFLQALARNPDHLDSLVNFGALLLEEGRHAEAQSHLEHALRIDPGNSLALNNLANLRREEGGLDDALSLLEQALDAKPDNHEARFSRAIVHLLRGELPEGWVDFESRWAGSTIEYPRPELPLPQWKGEEVGPDEGLLVYSEQGYGDSIQFVRYLPEVAARFGRVVFYTHPPLMRLFRRVLPDNCELRQAVEPYDPAGCSHHVPMLSLPLAMGTRLDTIPARVPYLATDPLQADYWHKRLDSAAGGRLKVGLAWAGRPTHKADWKRSIPLRELALLLDLPDLCWVSLQEGEAAVQREALSRPEVMLDWMGTVTDFADTADLIANLDLIISVDTAVAHLAGALGRPVWLLNRFESEWRWMSGREDSPWYPTLRIYTQPSAGDWAGVVSRVGEDLGSLGKQA